MARRIAPRKTTNVVERMMRRIEFDPFGGCWLWSGSVDSRGYGSINRGPGLGTERVHRISYAALNGEPPKGLVVMHGCDVKVCCNPQHLSLGTQAQNVRDAISRGLKGKGGKK